MLERFATETDVDVVLLAGRYTLLEQTSLDSMLPACASRGVAVLAAGVFNSGLLATDDPPPSATYNYATAPPELHAKAVAIAEVCKRHGVSLPQVAMAFAAAHPAVAALLVGAQNAEQMRRNAALFDAAVAADVWVELKEAGLLRADAPVPA
jgi:D-threo-aldose 1-dehydrogenase